MQGTITSSIDFAQVVLYVFWAFAAGLIFYLRREDKREGYPLESERSPYIRVQGFPWIPEPKTFRLSNGHTVQAPNGQADTRPVAAEPFSSALGSPLVPTGNPMVDGVGPAAYANREDVPELTFEGHPMIVPIRVATDHSVAEEDAPNDPRGMEVLGADRRTAGTVSDLWTDRGEPQIRYLEVETTGKRRVLVPMTMVELLSGRRVFVRSVLASQFEEAPTLRNPDVVTKLEEDRICGYFAGGTLYATPDRQEPLF